MLHLSATVRIFTVACAASLLGGCALKITGALPSDGMTDDGGPVEGLDLTMDADGIDIGDSSGDADPDPDSPTDGTDVREDPSGEEGGEDAVEDPATDAVDLDWEEVADPCGNGILDVGEECDTGGPTDLCDEYCRFRCPPSWSMARDAADRRHCLLLVYEGAAASWDHYRTRCEDEGSPYAAHVSYRGLAVLPGEVLLRNVTALMDEAVHYYVGLWQVDTSGAHDQGWAWLDGTPFDPTAYPITSGFDDGGPGDSPADCTRIYFNTDTYMDWRLADINCGFANDYQALCMISF